MRIIKNFVLFVENCERFFGGLIFVKVAFGLGKEGSLLYDSLVLLNYVSMTCRQALNLKLVVGHFMKNKRAVSSSIQIKWALASRL